jgi:hypothetical protein
MSPNLINLKSWRNQRISREYHQGGKRYFFLSNVKGIKRLDQSHLYPNLEVPGLTNPGRESNPGLPRGKRAL